MPIIIKEMYVKSTVVNTQGNALTGDDIRKLKQDIIREINQAQKVKNNWQKEP